MDINELVRNFSTTPFLFIGSGFSRRYYNLPDWVGLLRTFIARIDSDKFAYNRYESQARLCAKSESEVLPYIAELVQQDFNSRWYADSTFRTLTEEYLKFVEDGQSPFKVEVSQFINQNSHTVPGKQAELDLFKSISVKSLAGVITTNYDCLLEKETDGYKSYVGQEELIFSPSQGWAEIYKIHGSITNPKSIILTESDYKYFKDYCPYLASKLMTIFMEYPIIFIGYSLNDSNIQLILKSIVKCLSSENLEKLQNRFIYVEWAAGQNDFEISHASITIDDKVIRMTSIKTDNFAGLYEALSAKRAKMPAKLIRLFKQEFYNFALTNQPTATIRVADVDDGRIGDEELILAIGKPSQFNLRGLRGLSAGEWYRHVVMHDLEFSADEILQNAYPPLIASNNILPLNMLLKEAVGHYPDCEAKARHSFDDTLSSTIKKSRANRQIAHRSVNGILEDNPDNLPKAMSTIAHLYEHEIDCNQLEAFLKKCFSQPDFYENLASYDRSCFNRLVKIYDWLKYGK